MSVLEAVLLGYGKRKTVREKSRLSEQGCENFNSNYAPAKKMIYELFCYMFKKPKNVIAYNLL